MMQVRALNPPLMVCIATAIYGVRQAWLHIAEVAMCVVQPFLSRLEPCLSQEKCLLRAWTLGRRPSFAPLPWEHP